MDLVPNGISQRRSPYQRHRYTDPNTAELWPPALSLTGFDAVMDSSGLVPRPQNWPGLIDPVVGPVQPSTEENLPQKQRVGITARDHDLPSHPSIQDFQATASSFAARRRKKAQSDREDAPRPERKNTKRRRTGPDRFENYLHGDTPLPWNATTKVVFEKFPNHITDEDIEECWRLGLSARQISELMPEDTHFNSEGVHVQQHHSLIQKKFKKFKLRYEVRQQALKDQAAQLEGQGSLSLSTRGQTSIQEAQDMDPNTSTNVPASTASAVAELLDLKFRYYPFDPTGDQAFEARMSIEIAKIAKVAGHVAHKDHEIWVLNLLIKREIQRHSDLLERRFIQTQPSIDGSDLYPSSQTDGGLYQQRLHSYVDGQRVSHYILTSRNLSGQGPLPRIDTASTVTASEALRQLHFIVDRILVQHSFDAAPPSSKRPIFNFEHTDLRQWRVLARLLYYLVSITKALEDGPNTEPASTPTVSSATLPRAPRPFEEVRARPGNQTMFASDEESSALVGLPPVRYLASNASHRGYAIVGDQQSLSASFDPATGAAPVNRPRTMTKFTSASSPTAGMMLSTSAKNSFGLVDAGPTLAPMRPPYHIPKVAGTIKTLSDRDDAHKASAGAGRERHPSRTYNSPFPVSPMPAQSPRNTSLPSPATHLPTKPLVGLARFSLALGPEVASDGPRTEATPHKFSSPQEVFHDALPPTQSPQAPATLTASLQAETNNLLFETDDYIFFPSEYSKMYLFICLIAFGAPTNHFAI